MSSPLDQLKGIFKKDKKEKGPKPGAVVPLPKSENTGTLDDGKNTTTTTTTVAPTTCHTTVSRAIGSDPKNGKKNKHKEKDKDKDKEHEGEESNIKKKFFSFLNELDINIGQDKKKKKDKDKKDKKDKDKDKDKEKDKDKDKEKDKDKDKDKDKEKEKEKETEKDDDKKHDKNDKSDAPEKKKKKKQQALNKAPNALEEVVKWANKTLDKSVKELADEFNNMNKNWVPENSDTTTAFLPENAEKNRYKDIPCLEASRVKLKNNVYIHANYVDTSYSKKRFICTQGPLDNTCQAFWQMIVEDECEAILMLCNVVEGKKKKCAEYYPQKAGQIISFGDYTIKATKQYLQSDDPNIEITVLGVKYPGSDKTLVVKHFRWIDWPDRGVPDINLTPTNMLSSVRGSKKPIVVHCSAGIGRTGTITLIEFILEKMLSGQNCEDTLECLKDLRRQRAQSVQSDMQYIFIHRFLLHYFIERKSIEMSQKYLEFGDDYDAFLKKFIKIEEEKRKEKEAKESQGESQPESTPAASPQPQQQQGGPDPFLNMPDAPTKLQGVTAFGSAPEPTVAMNPTQQQQPK